MVHDPLYKWNLSPLQVRKRQQKNNGNGNSDTDEIMDIVRGTGKDKDNKERDKDKDKDRDNNDHRSNNSFGRDAAERTLQRIKNKLLGFEDTTSGVLSVEGQVELVVTEAKNVDNLCKLFVGWSPWL